MQTLLLATSLLLSNPVDVEKTNVTTNEVSQFVQQQVQSTSKQISLEQTRNIKFQTPFYQYKVNLAEAKAALKNQQTTSEAE